MQWGETFGDHADDHQIGVGAGPDRDRGVVGTETRLVALPADHVRPAGQRPHRQRRHPNLDTNRRGVRSAQATEMVDPRPCPLLHHVGFFILITVYIEAYGTLFQPNFHIPIVGRWDALGFLQDFIALAVLGGIITFSIIRLRSEPKEHGRSSRFYGSHTGGAWLILFMISLVIISFAIFRGAAVNTGNFPYGWGRFSRKAWASSCIRWAKPPTSGSKRSRC